MLNKMFMLQECFRVFETNDQLDHHMRSHGLAFVKSKSKLCSPTEYPTNE